LVSISIQDAILLESPAKSVNF